MTIRRAGAVYVYRLAERRHASSSSPISGRATSFSAPLTSALATATQLPGTDGRRQILQPDRLVARRHASRGYSRVRERPAVRRRRSTISRAQIDDDDLDDETYAAKWLADSRRVVYFAKNGWELVVLDTVTRKRTVVDVRLPGTVRNEMFAISPDNRTIYYGAARAEADIWIVERK